VLGKSSRCEEKSTPGIIRDADKTFHFVIPQNDLLPQKCKKMNPTFTGEGTFALDIIRRNY